MLMSSIKAFYNYILREVGLINQFSLPRNIELEIVASLLAPSALLPDDDNCGQAVGTDFVLQAMRFLLM
jgi:hypothetical protein